MDQSPESFNAIEIDVTSLQGLPEEENSGDIKNEIDFSEISFFGKIEIRVVQYIKDHAEELGVKKHSRDKDELPMLRRTRSSPRSICTESTCMRIIMGALHFRSVEMAALAAGPSAMIRLFLSRLEKEGYDVPEPVVFFFILFVAQ
jgi:hypothetical protein